MSGHLQRLGVLLVGVRPAGDLVQVRTDPRQARGCAPVPARRARPSKCAPGQSTGAPVSGVLCGWGTILGYREISNEIQTVTGGFRLDLGPSVSSRSDRSAPPQSLHRCLRPLPLNRSYPPTPTSIPPLHPVVSAFQNSSSVSAESTGSPPVHFLRIMGYPLE